MRPLLTTRCATRLIQEQFTHRLQPKSLIRAYACIVVRTCRLFPKKFLNRSDGTFSPKGMGPFALHPHVLNGPCRIFYALLCRTVNLKHTAQCAVMNSKIRAQLRTFGGNVRRLRTEKGLTQDKLAELTDLRANTIIDGVPDTENDGRFNRWICAHRAMGDQSPKPPGILVGMEGTTRFGAACGSASFSRFPFPFPDTTKEILRETLLSPLFLHCK